MAAHLMFFVVDRSISRWSFFFPKEHPSGSPFSVAEAMLRDGCPPHDGQSAAHAAVAETARDKRRLPADNAIPRETPATIFLNPLAGCG